MSNSKISKFSFLNFVLVAAMVVAMTATPAKAVKYGGYVEATAKAKDPPAPAHNPADANNSFTVDSSSPKREWVPKPPNNEANWNDDTWGLNVGSWHNALSGATQAQSKAKAGLKTSTSVVVDARARVRDILDNNLGNNGGDNTALATSKAVQWGPLVLILGPTATVSATLHTEAYMASTDASSPSSFAVQGTYDDTVLFPVGVVFSVKYVDTARAQYPILNLQPGPIYPYPGSAVGYELMVNGSTESSGSAILLAHQPVRTDTYGELMEMTFEPWTEPGLDGQWHEYSFYAAISQTITLPLGYEFVQPPTFEQLDWVGPFDPVPESSWGRVTLDINEPPGFYYLNLSVDTDGDETFAWVIQNMSIESTGESQTVSSFFDIFFDEQNYDPHDVPILTYMYSIDPVPQAGPPTGDPITSDVTGVSYQVGGEEDVTLYDLPIPYPSESTCAVKMSGRLPNLGSFVNQPQGTNQCAPGAISNSLKYLQATGGIDPTADTSIGTVGGQIGTTANGTPSSWYDKKQRLPYFTNLVTTRYIEAPLTLAKIQDLINELNRGQDIEMDLIGHVEVLAGIRVKCDSNTVDLDLFDDNQTDNQSDPMHTSTLNGTLGTSPQYVDGMELERFVIECPKEEEPHVCIPYFRLDTEEEWLNALASGEISPMEPGMEPGQWGDYMNQWADWTKEGDTYPDNEFLPAYPPTGELYVYGGGGAGGTEPNDSGLVLVWAIEPGMPSGDYASSWGFTPPADPDYSNCTVTVMVTAPQITLIPPHVQMNQVSLGLQDINGNIRAWYWNCPNPIPWNVPTQLSVDCSQTGMGAANPTATGYMNNPGFDITKVQTIIVDENGNWVPNPNPPIAPAPGTGMVGLWNYWHWMMVSPNTTVEKGIYKKWAQPPIVIDPNDPPIIEGWDEYSDYRNLPIVADDWECKDDRPITDIHWWGSWLGWNQPTPPQPLPQAFHLGIWTDVPDPDPCDQATYSHPGTLIWENYCDNYVWNFAGYDSDPRQYKDAAGGPTGVPPAGTADEPNDSCFQFTQLLSEDEWFYQEPNDDPCNPTIYWLSIAPIWPVGEDPLYQWGWKTRRHYFQDDAVSMQPAPWWPPVVGTTTCPASAATPIKFPPFPDPDSLTWDMAFELTTNEPAYEDDPILGDLDTNMTVNFRDLAILANNWLAVAPVP